MKDAKKLIKEIEKKRKNWNEKSQFKFGKVGNLSVADLDTIEFYAQTFDKTGKLDGLMQPRGGVAKVLAMYGVFYN